MFRGNVEDCVFALPVSHFHCLIIIVIIIISTLKIHIEKVISAALENRKLIDLWCNMSRHSSEAVFKYIYNLRRTRFSIF